MAQADGATVSSSGCGKWGDVKRGMVLMTGQVGVCTGYF